MELKIKKFVVLGNPVQHSLSPFIHQQFARQLSISISYEAINIASVNYISGIEFLTKNGISGANVTAPFKELFFPPKAVNTITVMPDGSLRGDNTDGIGLIRDLQRNNISIKNKKLLILGAGGAVKGILPTLIKLQPQEILIVNRNLLKAQQVIAMQTTSEACNVKLFAKTYAEIDNHSFDIVLNATSTCLYNQSLLYTKFNFENKICYDLNYGANSNSFLDYALGKGAIQVFDGLGMLVEQAAEAFFIWHKVRPHTESVFELLNAQNSVTI